MQTLNHRYWVAKFGGTSVATYEAMVRCVKVIDRFPSVRVIVVSAPAGITNLLIQLMRSDTSRAQLESLLREIKNKIHAILTHIPLRPNTQQLRQEVIQILREIDNLATSLSVTYHPLLADELLACGERISARLFACVLLTHGFPAEYLDARTLIKTNDCFGKADVLISESHQAAETLILPKCADQIVVTEGFIGSTTQNITTTLGRGGSDYTAALLAEAIHAEVLQIWTDVSGIYTVDPNLVAHAKQIKNMCFTEAAELAQFGAKVLHPATLWPAIRKNIPVFVGSSSQPQAQGTWIRAHCPDEMDMPLVRSVALRRRQSLLTISSLEMLHAHGFLAKVFAVLARHELSVDIVTTSEVSVALTLNHAETGTKELLTPAILDELRAIGNVSLKIDNDLCLVALVGNRLHHTAGVSGRLFSCLSQFNIRLICHGASAHNLCFLINEYDAEAVIQTIHAAFFEND